MMREITNAMLAMALAQRAVPAGPVDPMATPQRNLFYEGAEMPVSQRLAEQLVGGQSRVEQREFQKNQRPVRDRWTGFEFGT